MQIDEKSLNILKNFASINPNIYFDGTSTIRTIAEARNVLAKAELESFPDKEVGIYDLSEFLATLGLLSDPKLSFKKEHVLIEDQAGRSRIKYFYTNPQMLTYPTRDYAIPSVDVSFSLDENTLSKLKKAAATLGHEELSVKPSSSGILELSVVDLENKTSNTFSMDVPGKFDDNAKFNFVFNIANLKLIMGEYEVQLSQKLLAKFINKNSSALEYFIAMEKTSEYDE